MSRSLGMCGLHYQRMKRFGTTHVPHIPRQPNSCSTHATYIENTDERMQLLIWAAGFFDGEGCATLTSNGDTYYARLNVTQTRREPLLVFQRLFGGGVHKKKVKPTHAQSWFWQATGVRASMALQEIRPWLLVKAAPADIVIAYQQGREYGRRSFPVSAAERDRRHKLRTQLTALNRRGA